MSNVSSMLLHHYPSKNKLYNETFGWKPELETASFGDNIPLHMGEKL